MFSLTGIALAHEMTKYPSMREWELRLEGGELVQMVHRHHVDVIAHSGVEIWGRANRNGLQYFQVSNESARKAKSILRSTIYGTDQVTAEDSTTHSQEIIAGNLVFGQHSDRCRAYAPESRLGRVRKDGTIVSPNRAPLAIRRAERVA